MFKTLERRLVGLDQSLEALLNDPAILEDYLRYYQYDALKAVQRITQRDRNRTYVQMPTSSGKTEVMLAMVEALIRNAAQGRLPRMFMVEPTQKLVRDTRARLMKHFPHIPVGVYYADEQNLDNALTIITGDSFNDLLEFGIVDPEETDYLFLDEAHRWLTKMRRDALKPFYRTSVITGFTATSRFNELKALYRTLGEEAYSIDYETLIKEGYIAERASVIVGMDLPQNAGLRDQRRAYSHAVVDIIKQYRDGVENNERIVGDKIMVFDWNLTDVKYTAHLLNTDPEIRRDLIAARGNPDIIPAAVIEGSQNPKVQDAIVKDFDEGRIAYLVGARVHIEGLDTKAQHVITPERWSELEMEQVGGRVRDKSGLCRIFTVCRENSGKRKSAFYSESIGAERITREGAQHGLARPMGGIELSHPRIGNLNVYNTANEVASYINSRTPERTRKAEYHGVGAAQMTENIVAWKPEVEYIYKLLNAQHRSLPEAEKFCHVGGISIPREFLRLAGDSIVVREDVGEIIQDMIGNYPEISDHVIAYSDIGSDLSLIEEKTPLRDLISDTNQLFAKAERAYAEIFLPWKYGTETEKPESTTFPDVIRVNGTRIPVSQMRPAIEGETVTPAIREEILGRFWAQRMGMTEASSLTSEFADVSGERVTYIWELVKASQKRRQELLELGYEEITPEIYETLRGHVERTGKGAQALLYKATDKPDALNAGKLHYYLSGRADKIRKDYLSWILARYESFPADPYVEVSEEVWRTLKHHQERTGIGPVGLLRAATNITDGLDRQRIQRVLNRQSVNIRQEGVDWLLEQYAALPDNPRIEITEEDFLALKAHQKRTRAGASTLLDVDDAPEGLTEIKIVKILEGQPQTWFKNHRDFLCARYESLPDMLDLTDEVYQTLKSHAERTGKWGQAVLTGASDIPDGLNGAMASHYLSGKAKQIRKTHQDWLLARYEALPDDPCVELTEEDYKYLQDQQERTGMTATLFVRNVRGLPADLTRQVIQLTLSRIKKTMRAESLAFLKTRYADFPDDPYQPLTSEMVDNWKEKERLTLMGGVALISEVEAMGVSIPRGLSRAKAQNILAGKPERIHKDHVVFFDAQYESLLENPYVAITNDLLEAFRKHQARTGKKALALFYGATDVPNGLTHQMANYYFSGRAEKARKKHIDWLLTRYESIADDLSVEITENFHQHIIQERKRTGVEATGLMEGVTDAPQGMNRGKIHRIFNKGRVSVTQADIDWLKNRYAGFPDNPYVNVTEGMIASLKEKESLTGMGIAALLSDAKATGQKIPDGLTKSTTDRIFAGRALTIHKDHLAFLNAQYDILIANPYVEITDGLLLVFAEHQRRTGVKAHALISNAENLPDGMNIGKANYYLSGKAKKARKNQIDWMLGEYENLPDADMILGFNGGPR
jgi:superfamily II DNA or RNA helicase